VKKNLLVIICAIVCVFLWETPVRADMGPKPDLKIIVKNAPEEEYYLDLLVDYSPENNYIWLHEEKYKSEKIQILRDYRDGDWRAAKVTGTRVPLSGELIGEKDGDNMIHHFYYVGVPDKFRIIILTSDNKIITSDVIKSKAFNSVVYYDYATNKVTKKSVIFNYIIAFLITCSSTLLIEGIILLLFGFSLKKNYKAFLIINIVTQLCLYCALLFAMYIKGISAALSIYIVAEVYIFCTEIMLFLKYFTPQKKKRIIAYALTANILSFFSGIVFMVIQAIV
jgi:hypothetical protein